MGGGGGGRVPPQSRLQLLVRRVYNEQTAHVLVIVMPRESLAFFS